MFTGELAVKFRGVVQMIVAPTQGLMRLFPLREDGVFEAESVEYDLMQEKEGMAIPRKRGDSPNRRTSSLTQQVQETPPYISESMPINVNDLRARSIGVDKYSDADTSKTEKLIRAIARKFAELQRTIDRQIEWQAAEILQRGVLDYTTFTGLIPAPLNTIDFKMDSAMFPTTAVTWNTATGQQMRDDLESLGDEIRKRGKKVPTDVLLGRAANERFWNAAGNLTLLDNRRTEIGMRAPEALRADGFALQGEMLIGPYKMRFWVYEGWYDHPDGSTGLVKYIDDESAIVFSENGERDRYHAGVNIIIPTDAEIAQLVPGFANLDAMVVRQAVDFQPWAFTDTKKKTTEIGIDTAPLLVPTNRAAHGRIDTLAT